MAVQAPCREPAFIKKVIDESMDVWRACLTHPFLQELADGSLPMEKFQRYIIQDSLYLMEYAKVFAIGILKAKTLAEIQTYYSLLQFVNESEDATRLAYLRQWGITQPEVEATPVLPENAAYTTFMKEAAQEGGMPEIMMAVLPCMFSYYWLAKQLTGDHPKALDGPFAPFWRDYSSDSYYEACRRWAEITEEACHGLSAAEQKRLSGIFRESSMHELHFWEMSYQQDDIC